MGRRFFLDNKAQDGLDLGELERVPQCVMNPGLADIQRVGESLRLAGIGFVQDRPATGERVGIV